MSSYPKCGFKTELKLPYTSAIIPYLHTVRNSRRVSGTRQTRRKFLVDGFAMNLITQLQSIKWIQMTQRVR